MMGGLYLAVKFSVIIPTYNRLEQLVLTLAAFNLQTFSKDAFEVIVVDDASSNDTKKMVKEFDSSYSLYYTSTEDKRGRASARNRGITLANGDFLIFCDSDFIVTPDCLQVFSDYHKKYPNTVISAFPNSWNRAYVQYYSLFSNKQKKEMYETLKRHDIFHNKLLRGNKNIIQLLKPNDLYNNFYTIHKYISAKSLSEKIKKQYQSTDVAPWLMFVTRCISVEKKHVDNVGGFDEDFIHYGLEDWELGYRLHRQGIFFKSIKEIVGYHQEHPRKLGEPDGTFENLRLMYKKFGFIDQELNLFAVSFPLKNIVDYKKKLRMLKRYERDGNDPKAQFIKEVWKHKAIRFFKNK